MNSTALRSAVGYESKIVAPADIQLRKTGQEERFKHWAVSPPQEWFKRIMQRADTYQIVVKEIMKMLEYYGIKGGCILFHPWRLDREGTEWVISPHFHVVGYGHLNNMAMRKDLADLDSEYHIWNDDGRTESWIVENIHADERIKSIRHTIGYVLTHVGLGSYERHPDIASMDERLLIPLERNSDSIVVKRPMPAMFRSYQWESWEHAGRALHLYPDVSAEEAPETFPYNLLMDPNEFPHNLELDFVGYAEDYLLGRINSVRYFGTSVKVRNFDVYQEKKIRKCPECGSDLGRYGSIHSCSYAPAEYVHRSPIRVMRDDYCAVSDFWDSNVREYSSEGLSVLDFAMSIPHCSTPETAGLTKHDPNETVEVRKERRSKKIVYLWSDTGFGVDPVLVTPQEEAEYRKLGRVADIDDREALSHGANGALVGSE